MAPRELLTRPTGCHQYAAVPEALISTRFKARGPWLLDSIQLQKLEAATDPFFEGRVGAETEEAAGAAHQEVCSRLLTVFLSGGRELPVKSFKEAINNPACQHEIPAGFSYNLKLGQVQGFIRVTAVNTNEPKRTKSQDQELEIKLTPQSSRVSQELFVALRDWADDVGPSMYQRGLLVIKPFAIICLVVMLIIGLGDFLSPAADPKQVYKAEAHKILGEGVNQSNQQRAIEILLALQTDYTPPVQHSIDLEQ